VINGALEAIYEKPDRRSEEQLIIKPFPQFQTGDKDLKSLWEEYRQRMIPLAGIAIFIFGNKNNDKGEVVDASGVIREFEIAVNHGLIPIPIAVTGYVSQQIYEKIAASPGTYYPGNDWMVAVVKELAAEKISGDDIIKKILTIIQKINNGK